eukprot:UN05512
MVSTTSLIPKKSFAFVSRNKYSRIFLRVISTYLHQYNR